MACSGPWLFASAHVAKYNLSLSDLRLGEEEDDGGERARRSEGRPVPAPASPPCDLLMIHPTDSVATIPTLAADDTAPGPEPGPRRQHWSGQAGSLKGAVAVVDVLRCAFRDRSHGTVALAAAVAPRVPGRGPQPRRSSRRRHTGRDAGRDAERDVGRD